MSISPPMLSSAEARAMDIDTPWEREYWAKHFHVSELELVRIVQAVGADADAVTRFIRERARS